MESEAVLSLPVEGRWLYVTILLSADDVGLFEATEFKLARRAEVNRDLAGKLLQMLADEDLIRLYEVDGKRYGFIPKFRQRVQIKNTKHPLPPREFYADDSDALNKINYLASKTTVGAPVGSGCASDGQPPEAEAEVEEKVSETTSPRRRRAASDMPPCPYAEIVAVYHEVLPELPSVLVMKPSGKRAKAMAALWTWVLTSTKRSGERRATTQAEGLTWLRGYFTRAKSNDFIMGRTPRGAGHENWEADIDYLCSESGMRQVIEKTKEAA
jgi:hypothetical protein